jgi:hypothetical protein
MGNRAKGKEKRDTDRRRGNVKKNRTMNKITKSGKIGAEHEKEGGKVLKKKGDSSHSRSIKGK